MPDTRAPTVPQFTRRLGIETPEHLVLELELAGLGSRMAATVCDAGLLTLAFVLLGVGIQLLPTPTGGNAESPWSTLAAIVLILTGVLLFWGYFLLFEAQEHREDQDDRGEPAPPTRSEQHTSEL